MPNPMSRLSPDTLEQFFVRVSMLFAAGFIFAEGLQNWIRGRVETHPEVVLLIIR